MSNELNLENKIMDKVISGEVKMKPRLYFILGSALSFAGIVGLMVGAVFFTNLTLFLVRKQGPGTGRLIQMFEAFPLWVPLMALFFVILGFFLLKRYDFSYKKNFKVIAVTLLVAVLLSAKIIDSLGLNEIWSKRGPMRRFYSKDQTPVFDNQRQRFNRN